MSTTSTPPILRVGFVGTGNMGRPMAANLVRAGFGSVPASAST